MSAVVSDSNKVFTATDNAAFYGNSFTASIWYKFTSDPNDYAYAFGNAKASSDGWNLLSSQNTGADNLKEQARLSTGSQYNVLSTTARTSGVWHFIALTFNSGANELKLYYGNESTSPVQSGSTVSTSGSMGTSGGNLSFGANPNDVTARAQKISDARIYNNTVRSLAQIQSDYKQRLVGNETGLTDYWKFNESSGNTADNSTSARDATATAASWDTGDDPAFSAAYTKDLSETITISEPSFLRAFTRTFTDTPSISDSISNSVARLRSFSDVLTTSDRLFGRKRRTPQFTEETTSSSNWERQS